MKDFNNQDIPKFPTHEGNLHKSLPGHKDSSLYQGDEEDGIINENDPEKKYIPIEEISGGDDYLSFGEDNDKKSEILDEEYINRHKSVGEARKEINQDLFKYSIKRMKTGVSGVAHIFEDQILVSEDIEVCPSEETDIERSIIDERYSKIENVVYNKAVSEKEKNKKSYNYFKPGFKSRPKREENIKTAKKKSIFINKEKIGKVKKEAFKDEAVFEDTY